jgi:hypothetical protein
MNKPAPQRTRSHGTPNKSGADADYRVLALAAIESDRARTAKRESERANGRRHSRIKGVGLGVLAALSVGVVGAKLVASGGESRYDLKQKSVEEARDLPTEELGKIGLQKIIVQPGETLGETAERILMLNGEEISMDSRDQVIAEIEQQAKALDGDSTQHPGDIYIMPTPTQNP